MIAEELNDKNIRRIQNVCSWLFKLTNDFEFIEDTVREWIRFAGGPSEYPLRFRVDQAQRFVTFLEEFELATGSNLRSKERFVYLVQSNLCDDWHKLFMEVLPDLRGEVLQVSQDALRALDELPRPAWSNLLPSLFATQVLPPFLIGQYLSAVRRGCDMLRSTIREKTGLHGLDGADLINQAYGDRGCFAVTAWEDHSENNVRRGYTDLFRGAMTGIRNIHYHGTAELDELEAARLLVLLGTLWARAETTFRL